MGVEAYRKGSDSGGRSALTKKQQLRAEAGKGFLHYRWPHLFVDGDPYVSSCLDPRAPYFFVGPSSIAILSAYCQLLDLCISRMRFDSWHFSAYALGCGMVGRLFYAR